MLRAKLALVGGCVLAIGSGAHAASLLDPTPTLLNSWQTPLGYVSVVDNTILPPSLGVADRLLLSTGADEAPNVPSASAIEGYVGAVVDVDGRHPGFDAPGGAVEGAAVRRTFTASAGDLLTISFDFLTAEGSGIFSASGMTAAQAEQLGPLNTDDFAFVAITHAGITTVTRLADVLTPGMLDAPDSISDRFLYHTGFRKFQLTLPSAANVLDGSYAISLGVMDGHGIPADRNTIGESALLVDSITVGGPTAVPLPTPARAGCLLLASYLAASLARRVRFTGPSRHT